MNRKKKKSSPLRIIAIVFSIVGLVFLITSFVISIPTYLFVNKAVKTYGVVVDFQIKTTRGTTYHPIVRFKTAAGKEIQYISWVGSSPPAYQKGEKIEIFYNSDNPHEVKINSLLSLWLLPIIFTPIGGIFFLLGILFLIFSRNRKQ